MAEGFVLAFMSPGDQGIGAGNCRCVRGGFLCRCRMRVCSIVWAIFVIGEVSGLVIIIARCKILYKLTMTHLVHVFLTIYNLTLTSSIDETL